MVRSRLTLRNYTFRNIILRAFHKPQNAYSDYGIWNSDFIDEFKKMTEYEFHVISPHNGLIRSNLTEFTEEGIHYHIFKCDSNLLVDAYRSYSHYDEKTEYKRIRNAIMKIVEKVSPDVVVVCGAEQPKFSPAVWSLKKLPTLVLLETAVNDPLLMEMMNGTHIYGPVEKKTFQEMSYFGTANKKYYGIVRNYNNTALCLRARFPSHMPPVADNNSKEFDFVIYAAVLSKNKGVEDTIMAFNKVVKYHPYATLNVCGKCEADYLHHLESLVSVEAKGNVTFTGFFSSVDEKLKYVQKARCAVLPGITAPLNGTVREAMLMKLPTIVYESLATPRINKDRQRILAAKMTDVDDLADKMLFALDNWPQMEEIAQNAYEYAVEKYSNGDVARQVVNAALAVMDNFNKGIEIPKELIYVPE
jgi:glycosyltransferase involved in cell wall biosynthesis